MTTKALRHAGADPADLSDPARRRPAVRPPTRRPSGPGASVPFRSPTARRRPVLSRPPAGEGATPGDEEIVQRLRRGDPEALTALYDRYAGLLLSIAGNVLSDREEAEEVVQEVFVYLSRQGHRYDPERSSLTTWLALVTRSRTIDRLRHRRVVRETEDRAGLEVATQERPRGGEGLLREQRRKRLRAALATLPEEQRRVICLAYFRGMSQSQIAEATGLPLGTVKTRTLLGMRKLRRELEGEIAELL